MSGRFDKDKNKSKFQKYKFTILIFFMTGVMFWFFMLSPDDTKTDEICLEIIRLMLDDPDHDRLHIDYPVILLELHKVLDEKCDAEVEDMIENDDSNQIKINIGEP